MTRERERDIFPFSLSAFMLESEGKGMLINSMLTQGYTWLIVLVVFLYIAIKGNVKSFAFLPLDDKNDISPKVKMSVDKLMLFALSMTIFICGMLAFASLFPGTAETTRMLLP